MELLCHNGSEYFSAAHSLKQVDSLEHSGVAEETCAVYLTFIKCMSHLSSNGRMTVYNELARTGLRKITKPAVRITVLRAEKKQGPPEYEAGTLGRDIH
jgi:hypothetical protein